MNLKGAIRRFFQHIRFLSGLKDGCIKFQRSLAARFRVCTRTIRRWLTQLREGGWIDAIQRRGRTSAKVVMSTRMSTQEAENVHSNEPPPYITEIKPEGYLNHQTNDAEPMAEVARKSAGFERLSEGDRRYVAELQRSGVTQDALRAGIIVGRARRMVADSRGKSQPIRSLRYFGALFAEKFEPGYVEHVAGWLERRRA